MLLEDADGTENVTATRPFASASSTAAASRFRLLNDEVTPLAACPRNPCRNSASCIVYKGRFFCGCPKETGYVRFGQPCPSADGYVDDTNGRYQAQSFINVSSSLDLCYPNPCEKNAECIPYNKPHCRCRNGRYVPFDRPCLAENNGRRDTTTISDNSISETVHATRPQGLKELALFDKPRPAHNQGNVATRTSSNVPISATVHSTPLNSTNGKQEPTPSSFQTFHFAAIASAGILVMLLLLCWKIPWVKSRKHQDKIELATLVNTKIEGDVDSKQQQHTVTDETAKISYKQHLVEVSKIALVIAASDLFRNTLPLVDMAFVARLGTEELGAAALASSWFNMWKLVMRGLMTAVDTLLSQSFGARDQIAFRAWTGTSLLIIQIVTVIFSGIIALCGPAMRLFGQDPNLADMAGSFSYRLIPGLFPFFACQVLLRYLQTQDILLPVMVLGPVASGLNILFNWLLIFRFGMGIHGAPWATTVTRFIEFFLLLGYLAWNKRSLFQSVWPIVSLSSLEATKVRPFWDLSIPGLLGAAATAWAFEITTMFAGWLGNAELDAHSVTQTLVFMYSFPFSVAVATTIRVGQLIGAGSAADAKRSAIVSILFAVTVQSIFVAVLLSFKDLISHLLSSDEEVAALVGMLIPILCIFKICDAFAAPVNGAFRGLGRQNVVFWLRLFGYWVLGVPLGWLLAFTLGLGVSGLWWGFLIGTFASGLAGIIVFKVGIDWNMETSKAQERVSSMSKAE